MRCCRVAGRRCRSRPRGARGAGVRFVNETFDGGVCRQAIFFDPAGNALDLHQHFAPGGVDPSWTAPEEARGGSAWVALDFGGGGESNGSETLIVLRRSGRGGGAARRCSGMSSLQARRDG